MLGLVRRLTADPFLVPVCNETCVTLKDSLVGEGRDMDASEEKALAHGVAAIDMGLV